MLLKARGSLNYGTLCVYILCYCLLVFPSNYVDICYHFQNKTRCLKKLQFFHILAVFYASVEVDSVRILPEYIGVMTLE